jgi:hypothetical protein
MLDFNIPLNLSSNQGKAKHLDALLCKPEKIVRRSPPKIMKKSMNL